MSNGQEPLWPFGTRQALVAAPLVWFAMMVILVVTRNYLGWPEPDSIKLAFLVVIVLGLVPLGLRLLDFAASRRAVLDIKGVKIDFSGVDLSTPEVKRETPGIPDNIGVSGPIVSDTTPMDIIQTLEDATDKEVVVVDLKEGNAWWVTRLLALSAGAVRAGAPRAFVFIGKKGNKEDQFLGWAEPRGILEAILRSEDEYKERYDKAMRIAQQVIMYGSNEFVPQQPVPFPLHPDIQRYTGNLNFVKLGEAVKEQILMDQLATSIRDASLEAPPDKLTLGRLNDLFGHCLNSESIDLNWPNETQISCLLDSISAYIALVNAGRYESVIKKEDGERLLLRELFFQSKEKS